MEMTEIETQFMHKNLSTWIFSIIIRGNPNMVEMDWYPINPPNESIQMSKFDKGDITAGWPQNQSDSSKFFFHFGLSLSWIAWVLAEMFTKACEN